MFGVVSSTSSTAQSWTTTMDDDDDGSKHRPPTDRQPNRQHCKMHAREAVFYFLDPAGDSHTHTHAHTFDVRLRQYICTHSRTRARTAARRSLAGVCERRATNSCCRCCCRFSEALLFMVLMMKRAALAYKQHGRMCMSVCVCILYLCWRVFVRFAMNVLTCVGVFFGH